MSVQQWFREALLLLSILCLVFRSSTLVSAGLQPPPSPASQQTLTTEDSQALADSVAAEEEAKYVHFTKGQVHYCPILSCSSTLAFHKPSLDVISCLHTHISRPA